MPNEKEKYFKNYKLENIPDDSRKEKFKCKIQSRRIYGYVS